MRRWLPITRELIGSRPRLWASAVFGLALYGLLPLAGVHHLQARGLVAWNGFALLYLGLAAQMALRSDAARLRRRAAAEDASRGVMLVLIVVASMAVLLAIGSQLAAVKDLHGLPKTLHVSLAALTVVSGWLIVQTLFALHYAHGFYGARARGHAEGLGFPGTADPDYLDFFYFACVIGTSAQTADVSFTSSAMRRVGLLHCVLAFFFNTTVLALTINIAAGLF